MTHFTVESINMNILSFLSKFLPKSWLLLQQIIWFSVFLVNSLFRQLIGWITGFHCAKFECY